MPDLVSTRAAISYENSSFRWKRMATNDPCMHPLSYLRINTQNPILGNFVLIEQLADIEMLSSARNVLMNVCCLHKIDAIENLWDTRWVCNGRCIVFCFAILSYSDSTFAVTRNCCGDLNLSVALWTRCSNCPLTQVQVGRDFSYYKYCPDVLSDPALSYGQWAQRVSIHAQRKI